MIMYHYHDGKADFPHGSGPSHKGWYFYQAEHLAQSAKFVGVVLLPPPRGPYVTFSDAQNNVIDVLKKAVRGE